MILLPGVLEKSIIVIVESSVFYFHQVIECPGAVVDIGVLGGGGGNGLPGVGPPVVDGFVRGLPGVLSGVLVKSTDGIVGLLGSFWWIVSVHRIWLPETLGERQTPSL